jgi:hypothetical protein
VDSGSGNCRWIEVMWMITPEPWPSIFGNTGHFSPVELTLTVEEGLPPQQ